MTVLVQGVLDFFFFFELLKPLTQKIHILIYIIWVKIHIYAYTYIYVYNLEGTLLLIRISYPEPIEDRSSDLQRRTQ